MSSWNNDSWSSTIVFYFCNVKFYSFSWSEMFSLSLFFFHKNCVNLTKVYANILTIDSLNNTCNNVILLFKILFVKALSFFFSNLLKDTILCTLCCNTSKVLWLDFNIYNIAKFVCSLNASCIFKRNLCYRIHYFFNNFLLWINVEISCFSVHCNCYIVCFVKVIFVRYY